MHRHIHHRLETVQRFERAHDVRCTHTSHTRTHTRTTDLKPCSGSNVYGARIPYTRTHTHTHDRPEPVQRLKRVHDVVRLLEELSRQRRAAAFVREEHAVRDVIARLRTEGACNTASIQGIKLRYRVWFRGGALMDPKGFVGVRPQTGTLFQN